MFLLNLIGCNVKSQQDASVDSPGFSKVLATTTMLAENINLANEDAGAAGRGAEPLIVFSQYGHSVGYIAAKGDTQQVMHNNVEGFETSEVGHLKLSADGKHSAYDYMQGGTRIMVFDGVRGKVYDDVWEPVISQDGLHVAYVARLGTKRYIVVDKKVSPEYRSISGNPVFSGDSTKIAYTVNDVEKKNAIVVVSDRDFLSLHVKEPCVGELVANAAKDRIAVIAKVGDKLQVIDFPFAQPEKVNRGPLYDAIDKLAFAGDGRSLVYVGAKGSRKYLVLNGSEAPLPEGEMREPPVVALPQTGAGVIISSEKGHYLHEAFNGRPVQHKVYSEAAYLTYSRDGRQHAYCARMKKNVFMVVNGHEGPLFDIVVTPVFTPDGTKLIYKARKDGKRFVVVSDLEGKVLRQHPGYEMVYDIQFTADGQSVAYGVKDGKQLWWKVVKL